MRHSSGNQYHATGGVHVSFIQLDTWQIWSVLKHDPTFADTESLRPERFLEADGKSINKAAVEKMIAFRFERMVSFSTR